MPQDVFSRVPTCAGSVDGGGGARTTPPFGSTTSGSSMACPKTARRRCSRRHRWSLAKTQPNQLYTALLSLLFELPPEELGLPPLVLPVGFSGRRPYPIPKAIESLSPSRMRMK